MIKTMNMPRGRSKTEWVHMNNMTQGRKSHRVTPVEEGKVERWCEELGDLVKLCCVV